MSLRSTIINLILVAAVFTAGLLSRPWIFGDEIEFVGVPEITIWTDSVFVPTPPPPPEYITVPPETMYVDTSEDGTVVEQRVFTVQETFNLDSMGVTVQARARTPVQIPTLAMQIELLDAWMLRQTTQITQYVETPEQRWRWWVGGLTDWQPDQINLVAVTGVQYRSNLILAGYSTDRAWKVGYLYGF